MPTGSVFIPTNPLLPVRLSGELKPTNSMQPEQRQTWQSTPGRLKDTSIAFYRSLELLSPKNNETLRNNGRVIEIQVNSTPELLPGHNFQAWLDGKAYGPASSSSQWMLTEIDRGSHQVQVHLVDEAGKSLLQSAAATVYVHQTSLAERRRIHPCQEDDYGVRPECPLKDKPEKPNPLLRWLKR